MFKQLMGYIGEYKKYFILAPILVVGESVAELILPYLMGLLVGNGVGGNNIPYMYRLGAWASSTVSMPQNSPPRRPRDSAIICGRPCSGRFRPSPLRMWTNFPRHLW